MNHYICTGGCEGESATPGVCQTDDCPKKGQPLTECECTDGAHEPESHTDTSSEEKDS